MPPARKPHPQLIVGGRAESLELAGRGLPDHVEVVEDSAPTRTRSAWRSCRAARCASWRAPTPATRRPAATASRYARASTRHTSSTRSAGRGWGDRAASRSRPIRRATSRPASQPGARPRDGGRSSSVGRPAVAISQATTEFEFHISPASSSSRPHTGVGTVATRSSSRRATRGSLVSRRGPPTAAAEIRDRPAAPAADLVAKQAQPADVAAPDGARGRPRLGSPRRRPARARSRSCSDRRPARRRAPRDRGRIVADAGARLRWPRRRGR